MKKLLLFFGIYLWVCVIYSQEPFIYNKKVKDTISTKKLTQEWSLDQKKFVAKKDTFAASERKMRSKYMSGGMYRINNVAYDTLFIDGKDFIDISKITRSDKLINFRDLILIGVFLGMFFFLRRKVNKKIYNYKEYQTGYLFVFVASFTACGFTTLYSNELPEKGLIFLAIVLMAIFAAINIGYTNICDQHRGSIQHSNRMYTSLYNSIFGTIAGYFSGICIISDWETWPLLVGTIILFVVTSALIQKSHKKFENN